MNNVLSWFEIPCADLAKAQTFYETVMACRLRREAMGPSQGAVFPYNKEAGAMGGALVCGPTAPVNANPSSGGGVLIFLNGGDHTLGDLLKRVQAAGGQVCLPTQALPPGMGFFAHIIDLDGNKIGLHSLAS